MNSKTTFEALGVDEDILAAVSDLGYEQPTPIQAQAIEKLLKGHDLIGQSQTGTGKTAAFGIPLIELIDPEDRRLQAIILCPTRELCLQVTEDLRSLLKYKSGIRTAAVYGGQPIGHQINALKGGVQIVVGTPGRFIDHLRRHTLRLDQVQMAVLDEADEMLSMGFRDDMELILAQLPEPRQTVLLSATLPDAVRELAANYLESPEEILLTPDTQLTVAEVEEAYFEVKQSAKLQALERLLSIHHGERSLIFCNTKKQVAALEEALAKSEITAGALHGDLKQVQRDLVMRRFRSGELHLLIATDVAARGLDIQNISLVINYDIPEDPDTYVHRIGRTARAGKTGTAYTFVTGHELRQLQVIMQHTGTQIAPRRLPTLQEVEQSRLSRLMEKTRAVILSGRAAKYEEAVHGLMKEGFEAADIAAALLAQTMYDAASEVDTLSAVPTRVLRDDILESPMVKLHMNIGKKHHIRIKDIVGAIGAECGIPAAALGHIDLLETFSYLEVPAALAQDIVTLMDGKQIKGRTVKTQLAQTGR